MLIILKEYVHYLRHRFINQKIKYKHKVSYFYKNRKYRPLEEEKKINLVIRFQKFQFFHKCVFWEMLNVSSEHSFNQQLSSLSSQVQ